MRDEISRSQQFDTDAPRPITGKDVVARGGTLLSLALMFGLASWLAAPAPGPNDAVAAAAAAAPGDDLPEPEPAKVEEPPPVVNPPPVEPPPVPADSTPPPVEPTKVETPPVPEDTKVETPPVLPDSKVETPPPVADTKVEAPPEPTKVEPVADTKPPEPATPPPAGTGVPDPDFAYRSAEKELRDQHKFFQNCLDGAGQSTAKLKFTIEVRKSGMPPHKIKVISSNASVRSCVRSLFEQFPFDSSPRGGASHTPTTTARRPSRSCRCRPPLPRGLRDMSSTTSQDKPPGIARFGAGAALLLSLLGIGVGAYLTVLKFRMTFTPCASTKGACAIGGMSCEDALQSSWSTLLGLPISLWGSAFYLVVAVIAGGLFLRSDFLRGAARPLLLGLALFDIAVSAVYGSYAFLVLKAPCPYCLSLYVISALLLMCSLFAVHGAPRGLWKRLTTRRQADLLDALFVAGVVFVVGLGVQSVGFQTTRRFVDANTGCAAPTTALPATTIVTGAAEPKVGIALFLDLSCPHCSNEFRNVGRAIRSKELDVPTRVYVFHTRAPPATPTPSRPATPSTTPTPSTAAPASRPRPPSASRSCAPAPAST
ncbi:vitamin K epoxide reductase family protein [Nannocystis pusilla]|uniref:vitamin K epoxide reductase family protein n=1 Tax=Nannocystis pusilla TaxID=889268 RepID=UPI003B7C4B7A